VVFQHHHLALLTQIAHQSRLCGGG
jgi:hypothetical protein